jgi:hypothetical protein
MYRQQQQQQQCEHGSKKLSVNLSTASWMEENRASLATCNKKKNERINKSETLMHLADGLKHVQFVVAVDCVMQTTHRVV